MLLPTLHNMQPPPPNMEYHVRMLFGKLNTQRGQGIVLDVESEF